MSRTVNVCRVVSSVATRLRVILLCGVALSCAQTARAQVTGTHAVFTSEFPQVVFVDNVGTTRQWTFLGYDQDFRFQDDTAGTTPLLIQATAPSYSIIIKPNGDVGMGTFSPARKLHLYDDETPTIRLEQSNAIFTPKTYDIGADSDGFFIDDVSAGTTPMQIRSSAPSNSLYVASDGKVGLGTSSPSARIHTVATALSGAESLARFDVSDDAIGRLEISNATTGNSLMIPKIQGRSASSNAALITEGLIQSDAGANPVIVYNAAKLGGGAVANRPMVVYRNNGVAKVTVAASGNVTATGFTNSSSRTLKDNIVDLDSRQATDALRQLTPVQFVYKDDPTADRRVGFIAEDVPEIIAEPDRQSVPLMDVVALVTRVVKDQDRLNEQQQKTIEQQQKTIDELLKRLQALEIQARN